MKAVSRLAMSLDSALRARPERPWGSHLDTQSNSDTDSGAQLDTECHE